MKTLKQYCIEAHENAVEKGFWDKGRTNIPEKLMLIVSEISEAMEAHRKNKFLTKKIDYINAINQFTYIMKQYVEGGFNEAGEYVNDSGKFINDTRIKNFEAHIKDTFQDEIADTFIRLFDLCGNLDIDIEYHIEQKMNYNKTREKLHGKAY